jgi:spermidine synthase
MRASLLLGLAFGLIGFAATIGEIVALRELLTVASGSELALAVVFPAWLLWTAVGTIVGGKTRTLPRPDLFAWLQIASGPVLVGTVLFIRGARGVMGIDAGELVSLTQVLVIAFLTLAPFCFISGSLFTLACSVLAGRIPAWNRSPGLVYGVEGVGAGVGGLLFSLLLIHWFNALEIALGVAVILWLSGFLLLRQEQGLGRVPSSLLFALLAVLAVALAGANRLDRLSRRWQWPGFDLIESRETIYGHIVVVARGPEHSFFENGLWNFTVPDLLNAEESVHYALLQHPRPERVLLLGGGVSGSLAQVLEHPSIRQVDYVELDPAVIELGKNHLSPEFTSALEDGRVRIHFRDGRRYLAETPTLYDVILLNLPEPFTAQLNRFYTREFFRLAASRLDKGGILSFSASAPETALGPIQAGYLKVLYDTAASVFREIVLFPTHAARFFCARAGGVLTTDPNVLVQRLRERKLRPLYVEDHYMLWDLSSERQQSFMAMVKGGEGNGLNTDLNPLAYFFDLRLWGFQYSPEAPRILGALTARNVWLVLAAVCLLGVAAGLRRGSLRVRVLNSVAIFGFTGISLEILLVFSFQVLFGYVYAKLGLLLTLFMVGLALGSFTMSRYPRDEALLLKMLLVVQAVLGLFCLTLIPVITYLHGTPEASLQHSVNRETLSLVSLAAGFLGGTHFPLANRLLLSRREQVGRTAGGLYAFDLLGSTLGSLLVGLVLIPVVGVLQSLAVLALFNLGALVILATALRRAAASPPRAEVSSQ